MHSEYLTACALLILPAALVWVDDPHAATDTAKVKPTASERLIGFRGIAAAFLRFR
jgi:hypothetical protein